LEDELEIGRQQKKERDAAKLKAHQNRRKSEVAKKASIAGGHVQAWASKSATAASKRQTLSIVNSDEVHQAQRERASIHAEFKEQQQKDLEDRTAQREDSRKSVKLEANRILQQTEQERRDRQAEQAASAHRSCARKMEGILKKASQGAHEQECQAVLHRKTVAIEDFKSQASAHVEGKNVRSSMVLQKVKLSPSEPHGCGLWPRFEQRKQASKDRKRPQSSSAIKKSVTLNFDDHSEPSSGLTRTEGRSSTFINSPSHFAATKPKSEEDASTAAGDTSELKLQADPRLSSPNLDVLNVMSAAFRRSTQRHSDLELSIDPQEQEEFMQDLEFRCSKWHHEARTRSG